MTPYSFFFHHSLEVCPKMRVLPLLPGVGVVGYFTTPFVNSSSKFSLEKSITPFSSVSINGALIFKSGIINLFPGGKVLKSIVCCSHFLSRNSSIVVERVWLSNLLCLIFANCVSSCWSSSAVSGLSSALWCIVFSSSKSWWSQLPFELNKSCAITITSCAFVKKKKSINTLTRRIEKIFASLSQFLVFHVKSDLKFFSKDTNPEVVIVGFVFIATGVVCCACDIGVGLYACCVLLIVGFSSVFETFWICFFSSIGLGGVVTTGVFTVCEIIDGFSGFLISGLFTVGVCKSVVGFFNWAAGFCTAWTFLSETWGFFCAWVCRGAIWGFFAWSWDCTWGAAIFVTGDSIFNVIGDVIWFDFSFIKFSCGKEEKSWTELSISFFSFFSTTISQFTAKSKSDFCWKSSSVVIPSSDIWSP